jgi:hypothetical protein
LQDAHQQQRERCRVTERRVGRQKADHERRDRHQEDAQREHLLASAAVAEVRHDDAAERPREIAGREDAEGLQLAQPVRGLGREEQLTDHRREEDEDDEVVVLERAAERGEDEGLGVASRQRARGGVGGRRHGWSRRGKDEDIPPTRRFRRPGESRDPS